MGRRGWSTMPIPEGWVQVIRGPRPKSEVWPRAKSGMPSQKDPQGGSKQPARTVEEFFPGRFEQGAQSRDCSEFVESRRIRSPSGASGSTTSGQGGDAETGATFFDDTRRASGRSSCESGQVGGSSGGIGGDRWCGGGCNQESPCQSQSCRPREASVRADRRLQEFHRSGREAIGEVGRRARVGARSVRGGARTACAIWRPTSQLPFLCHPQSLLQRWKQSWCVFEQSWPTLAHRFPHSPIVSGRILSPTQWKRLHCGCDAGSKRWRTRLPKVPKGMSPGWRMSSLREQFSCVSGHNHPRQW